MESAEPAGSDPAAEAAAAPPPRPAWPRLWPLALAVLLAATSLLLAGRARAAAEDLLDLGQMGLYALVAAFAVGAARRGEGPQAKGWRWLAAAAFLALAAFAVILGLAVAGQPVPAGDQLIPLLLLVNAVAFVGLVLLSPPDLAARSRQRLAVDGLIAGGSLMFIILVSTEWFVRRGNTGLADLLYPAVDAAAFMVTGLVVLHLGRGTPLWYRLLVGATVLVFIADSAFAGGVESAVVVDTASVLYLGLVASAALLARSWDPHTARPQSYGAQSAVYVPFGLAVLSACYDFVENDGVEAPLFFLLMTLVALIVARTLLVMRENSRLAASFEASDAFKTQLLRFISHEIANPLSPLKVQVRLLKSGAAAAADKAWQAIERSIGRLESLSRDVRLMALAETRRIVQSTEMADLGPRVAGAVQAHQAVAAQRGVRLRLEAPATPLAYPIDGERFDQVVDNLLSNALKFTPRGGSIDVALFRSPTGWAVFLVQDSGAGMTAEQQQRLFTAFGRPQGSTTPGLGLGLYLCKAIVDGHGGHISASSAGPGQGSRFRVELPPAVAPPAKETVGPRPMYSPQEHGGPDVPAGRPPDLPV